MSEPVKVEPEHEQHHVLYRMFDRNDRLLYVGITLDLSTRFKSHKRNKPWWSDVATIKLEHHADRASVLAAERTAICEERPVNNIRSRGPMPLDYAVGDDYDDCMFQAISEIESARYDVMQTLRACGDPAHQATVARKAAKELRLFLADLKQFYESGAKRPQPLKAAAHDATAEPADSQDHNRP